MKVAKVVCKGCGKEQFKQRTIRLHGMHDWVGKYCSPECVRIDKKKDKKPSFKEDSFKRSTYMKENSDLEEF